MNFQFYSSVITPARTSISYQLCPFSVLSVLTGSVSVVSLKHHIQTSSSFWPHLSFSPPHSSSAGLTVPWVTYSAHISALCCSPLLHIRCRSAGPTVGYYCLIKGRLGRCSPDKSIKLPLAVPEGEMDRNGFCPSEKVSQGAPLANGVRGRIC